MATNTIPSDKPSIYSALTGAQLGVLAYPSPLPQGLGGMVFDVVGEESGEFRSDITDEFLEDNTSVQDQWALMPERIKVRGSTGELVVLAPPAAPPPPQVVNPIPNNDPLSPTLTPGAQQAQDASQAQATAAAAAPSGNSQNLFQYYQGLSSVPTGRQPLIMGYLYQLWLGRVPMTVESPWGIFTSMAIEIIEPVQADDTTGRTDFTVTFKKLRFAKQNVVQVGQLIGRALAQAQEANPAVNGGIGQTTLSDQSANQILGGWAASLNTPNPIAP